MTADNTQREGNRLIAEFMQYALVSNRWFFQGEDKMEEYPPLYKQLEANEENQLYFNSQWNWIMIVIDKIESINDKCFFSEIRKLKFGANYKYQHVCRIKSFRHAELPIAEGMAMTKIDSVWQAIVQFIQWYNTNSK